MYHNKLDSTPEQEQHLARWLGTCRFLYNCTLEHRITAWKMCRVTITHFQQKTECKDIRAEIDFLANMQSHVLQDVLARLDNAYQGHRHTTEISGVQAYPLKFFGYYTNPSTMDFQYNQHVNPILKILLQEAKSTH